MKPLRWTLGPLFGALSIVAMGPGHSAPSADCNRECLIGIAEQYLAAIPQHEPSKAALNAGARYTENGVELTLPDGLWRTATRLGKYRLYVVDPTAGELGVYAKMEENGSPILVATHLQIFDRKINQIESIVARQENAVLGPGGTPRPDALGDAPRAQFLQAIPVQSQRSRQEMMDIVNTYFTGIENNDGSRPPLFADDCNRIENGSYTTNRPIATGTEATGANFSCKEAFAIGYYHEDTRLRDRRILVVDRDHGLVYTGMALDHDATVRTYTLSNGKTMVVKRTAPWTWLAHELFQIDKDGKISQVEAVLLSVPYGMRPGWSSGVRMPSPQAAHDGFSE